METKAPSRDAANKVSGLELQRQDFLDAGLVLCCMSDDLGYDVRPLIRAIVSGP